jgi:hypothetical protein
MEWRPAIRDRSQAGEKQRRSIPARRRIRGMFFSSLLQALEVHRCVEITASSRELALIR